MQLDFIYKVYQIYKQNHLDKTKVVAVSFGKDSISLLMMLNYLQRTINESIYILHCNHFSQKNNFFSIQESFKLSYLINSHLYISCPIISPKGETKQRLWRHRIYKRTINLVNSNSIFLGHTKTDKIETFFLNLLRGTNLNSLSNFQTHNIQFEHECFTNPTFYPNLILNKSLKINYYRPLLAFSRKEIKNLVDNNRIPNIVDRSNFNTNLKRNKIRLILLPLLKLYFNSNIDNQIERLLAQTNIDNRYFKTQIFNILSNKKSISKSEFRTLPKAIQYRILKKLLNTYSGRDTNFNLIQNLQSKI
jgi:tRNA(Ile)-lysidine synthase